MQRLEDWLAGVYKGTPRLSPASKQSITEVWPIVALVFGVLQLLAAIALWRTGHTLNQVVDTLNSLYGNAVTLNHLNIFYWISFVVLIADGAILLSAYPQLRNHKRRGWELLFYGTLLDFVYGVVSAFDNYGGITSFILQIIVTAVVLYFLFQIRDQYPARR